MNSREIRPDAFEMRSSPRVLAPDWYERLGKIPGGAWLLVAIFVTIMVVRDPKGQGWLAAISTILVLGGVPIALKRINTRIVITKEVVISRDSLRRVQERRRDEL